MKTTNLVQKIFVGLSLVFFVALFYSKFVLSLTLFGFAFLAFAEWLTTRRTIDLNLSKKGSIWILAYTLVFLSILMSGINSYNLSEWFKHLQLKLPFLVLPIAFYHLNPIAKKNFHLIIYAFLSISSISAAHVMLLYVLDMDYYNKLIQHGQSLATPIHHVSYSLILSFAAITGVILFLEDRYFIKMRWLALGLAGLLFMFMHILAVRTGIVTMYIGLIILSFRQVYLTKNILQGVGCMILCAIAPIIAYYFVPSFFYKVGYSVWDLTMLAEGKAVNYSDGGRYLSLKMGCEVFRENMLMGTGLGDLSSSCENWYLANVEDYKGKLNYPHNQFLFALTSTGLLGFFLYQLGIWIPFFKEKLYANSFTLVLYAIVFSTFFIETQLERSTGICFFLFFCLLVSKIDSKNLIDT